MNDKPEDVGPPPPKPVDFDDAKVNSLLDVVIKTKDSQAWAPLATSANRQLIAIAVEVKEEMDKRDEEYQEALAEWMAKKEAADRQREEEEEKQLTDEEREQRRRGPQPRDTLAEPLQRRI